MTIDSTKTSTNNICKIYYRNSNNIFLQRYNKDTDEVGVKDGFTQVTVVLKFSNFLGIYGNDKTYWMHNTTSCPDVLCVLYSKTG